MPHLRALPRAGSAHPLRGGFLTQGIEGLRILELATGVAGPYAGRLLAMLGATVVKLEPEGGAPVRRQPVDFVRREGASPLHVHLNAGKRLISDLPLTEVLPWADVVLESRVAHELANTPAEPKALAGNGPVLITSSPWGYASSRPGRVVDELLVQAAARRTDTPRVGPRDHRGNAQIDRAPSKKGCGNRDVLLRHFFWLLRNTLLGDRVVGRRAQDAVVDQSDRLAALPRRSSK